MKYVIDGLKLERYFLSRQDSVKTVKFIIDALKKY